MRIRAAILLLLPIWSLLTLTAKAQTGTTVKNALTTYYKKYPQEKLFIHTDQNMYASGQALWYKVYATAYGKPSVLSRIMYVQLTNTAGKLITQSKLLLTNSLANGNIDLPDSLHTGWYQLKAFTAWMMNFGEDGYFHQNIYIQNVKDTLHTAAADHAKYHIVFYPEGGDLLNANLCNVAFKATGDSGWPVNVYGGVFNNKNQPVAKLITVHDGMGIFSAEFSADSTYTAVVNFPDKTTQTIALPAVKKKGIAMQVNNLSQDEITVSLAYAGPADKYSDLTMAAFQNNGLIATYPLQLAKGINQFGIKKDQFAGGILRLTIFDTKGIPLAERLVFINNGRLVLNLKADTLSPRPYKKQAFTLNVKDGDGKPLAGNFSVSVTDEATGINDDANDNITSYLLMSSELRGYIHHPAWYFKNNSDTLQQQLDLVMLTNGWRHFKWDEVLHPAPVALHFPVEKEQFIAGKIAGFDQLMAQKQQLTIKLLIINQDSSKFIGYVTPDSTGSFILNDYNHSGTSTLFMEASDKKNRVKKLKIGLFNSLGDSVKAAAPLPFTINDNDPLPISPRFLANARGEEEAKFAADRILLKAVTVHEKKLTPTDLILKDHVSPRLEIDREYTLDLVNNPTANIGLVNYIRGRFPGLRVTESGIFIYGDSNTLQAESPPPSASGKPQQPVAAGTAGFKPYVYLNEAPVDFTSIEDISLVEIALIRFIPPPVFFAPYNGGNVGALMINTKNAADMQRNIQSNENFNQYTFNGYTITREFPSPDYSIPKAAYPPDNRSTLYWNHDLTAGADGVIKFHFYNSGKAKKFRVIVQGMDEQGRIGYLNEVL